MLWRLAVPLPVWRCLAPQSYHIQILVNWVLVSRWIRRLHFGLQFALVWVLGISGAYLGVVAEPQWSYTLMLQAGVLFPYFFLGEQLDWQGLARWKASRGRRSLLCGWLALFGLLFLYMARDPSRYFVGELEEFFNDHYATRCAEGCARPFLWLRYVALVWLRAALSLLFLLLCVPGREVHFSERGAHTLYPALLHLAPLLAAGRVLAPPWRAASEAFTSGALSKEHMFLLGMLLEGVMFFLAYAMVWALASAPCRRCFRWLVEPASCWRGPGRGGAAEPGGLRIGAEKQD